MVYDEEDENRGNKLYQGSTFLRQLWRLGLRNIAITPVIFKVGVAMLNVALILYIIGFVCPFWVVGAKHAYKEDSGSNRTESAVDVNGSGLQENDIHFGVWEECVIVKGETTCTIFTENIDSVILMLGCVGAFITFSLCCWTWLTCVRKPKKHRYLMMVVAAIIGSMFGFVSVFIFIAVQGRKSYSWALAVFLFSCILELSAAAVVLWGITRATANGLFPQAVEETEDTTTQNIPSIIATGPTPQKKTKRRAMRVLLRPKRVKTRSRPSIEEEEDHVDFVTLDMVSPVPDPPSQGKGKKTTETRRKKRVSKKDPKAMNESERRGRRALGTPEQELSLDLENPEPPPRHPSHTKPKASATEAREKFIRQRSTSRAQENGGAASVYIDTNACILHPRPEYGRSKDGGLGRHHEREERSSGPRRDASRGCPPFGTPSQTALPLRSSSGMTWFPSCRFVVDVHQPFSLTEALEALEDEPEAETVPRDSRKKPSSSKDLPELPSTSGQISPLQEDRPSETNSSPENLSKSGRTECSAHNRRQRYRTGHPRPHSSRHSDNVEKSGEGDNSQYVKYSPDTYYQRRNTFYSFKPTYTPNRQGKNQS